MIEQNTAHSHLFEVGDHDFETKVLTREAPVIVDFSADWCPPCRAIAPVYDALSDAYEGKLLFATMDTEAHPLTAARLGVQALPTFVLFKGGKVIGRLLGPRPGRLKHEIDRILAENGVV